MRAAIRTAQGLLLLSMATASAAPREAAAYSAAHGERALIVSDRGRIVFERGPALVQTPRVFSITKSLVSIGMFRDSMAGGISIGRPVSRGPARGVRLADLLNQTSGLEPMSGEFYSDGLEDKQRVFRQMKPARNPRSFVYGASHWEVLAEEIALVHGTPLGAWIRRFVPGAKPEILARWRRDGKGRMFFSTGARMSARELLPAAQAVLAGMGRGHGKWPSEIRSLLFSGTRQNEMYALGFWLNRLAASDGSREIDVENSLDPPPPSAFWRKGCLAKSAPCDLLAMIGSGGQRVYVVPSRGLVIIRFGSGARFSDAEFLGRYFGASSSKPEKAKG
jgi:CubicO group peptidase (beta-lactamase class C family)